MKSGKRIWLVLLFLGCVPFLAAFGYCLVSYLLDGGGLLKMSFWDYLVLYSFLYWPTYAIGIAFIVLSILKIKKKQ